MPPWRMGSLRREGTPPSRFSNLQGGAGVPRANAHVTVSAVSGIADMSGAGTTWGYLCAILGVPGDGHIWNLEYIWGLGLPGITYGATSRRANLECQNANFKVK